MLKSHFHLAPMVRIVELLIYFSSIHPQRWQGLLFLHFLYSVTVVRNLAPFFVWIFCITKLYDFWRLDISIFIKCKGLCFHYLKQFILVGVQQALNFVSSTTKPKYKLSLIANEVKYFLTSNSIVSSPEARLNLLTLSSDIAHSTLVNHSL